MRLLPALAVVAACAEPAPGIEGVSCQDTSTLAPSRLPAELDVVLVVSDAADMAPYRERLIESLRQGAGTLATLEGGLPSVQIAVVDEAGALSAAPRIDGCEPPDGAWIVDLARHWWTCSDDPSAACRDRNYTAALGDTLACVGALPADATTAPALLERLDRALAAGTFLRPDAVLLVIVISAGDDASPADPSWYAARLRAIHDAPCQVVFSVVAGADTPRLRAVLDALAPDGTFTSIDATTWADAFAPCASLLRAVIFNPCLRQLSGECVAAEVDGSALPHCRMATATRPDPDTALPCYWITPAPPDNGPDCPYFGFVERAHAGEPPALLHCPSC